MKKIFVLLLTLVIIFALPALVCSAALVQDGENYYEFGDVNTDNTVNVLDFIRIKKIISKNNVDFRLKVTDIDGDGDVDANDMISLQKLLLLGDYFENDNNWTTEY